MGNEYSEECLTLQEKNLENANLNHSEICSHIPLISKSWQQCPEQDVETHNCLHTILKLVKYILESKLRKIWYILLLSYIF